jgi:ankyrin repeat protein
VDEGKWDTIMREVVALRRRFHPNLIPLLASFTECTIESSFETKFVNMLFPYAEMDMEKWLYLPNPPTLLACQSRSEQRQYLYTAMCNLVSALAALHREVEGLVTSHHDLKPKNILVLGEKLMIADLGMSELVHLGRVGGSEIDGTKGLGTSTYHPPEYYREDDSERKKRKMFGRAFDMWAMGCIMVQVAVLIVWGWESGKLERFRKDREEFVFQQVDQGDGDRDMLGNNDSFVKSIPVVDAWLARLQEDGSAILQGYLAVTIQMLRGNPCERIYSWEVELDLYELLHLDEPKEARFAKAAALVQGPPPDKDLNGVETPIHRAAERGNLIRAINMLEVGWSAELKDGIGRTPVELAEQNGHLQLRDILLQANTIKESGWKSALKGVIPTTAIHAGEQSGFRLRQETPQQSFDTHHHPGEVRVLRANLRKAEISLAKLEKPQILKKERTFGRTVLHEAAQCGDVGSLRSLLNHDKANEAVLLTDDFGQTPLHCASNTSAEAASIILKATTDVRRLLLAEDQNGRTPLHIAAAGNPGVVEVLLHYCRNKADVRRMLQQEDGEGMTPLQVAWAIGQGDVKQMLDKALAATI